MGKVISFINQKGGVGKTTICINLGAGLAHFNKKVLIIDMDFQCNATTGLGLEREKIDISIFELLKDNIEINKGIKSTYLENLKIIPSSFELKHIEILSKIEPEKNLGLKNIIDRIKNEYDFILIDNPPSFSPIIYNSVFASDKVYIPVEMSYFGLEGLDQLENTINVINKITIEMRDRFGNVVTEQKLLYPPKVVEIGGVIINRWDSITRISKEIEEILKERYKEKLFRTKIRNNTTIKEAIGEGISIIDYAPSSNGAEDFINLTKEFIERENKNELLSF